MAVTRIIATRNELDGCARMQEKEVGLGGMRG
jgi:hypothetical protein